MEFLTLLNKLKDMDIIGIRKQSSIITDMGDQTEHTITIVHNDSFEIEFDKNTNEFNISTTMSNQPLSVAWAQFIVSICTEIDRTNNELAKKVVK